MPPNLEKKKLSTTPRPFAYRGVLILGGVLLLIGGAVIAFVFLFSVHYRGMIYPGVRLGTIDLGGVSYEVAADRLEEAAKAVADQGIVIQYDNITFTVATVAGDPANPELTTQLVHFEVEQSIQRLRRQLESMNEAEHVYYWLAGYTFIPTVTVDEEALAVALREELAAYEQPAVDARLVEEENDTFSISAEKGGQAFDYKAIITAVKQRFSQLSTEPIVVALTTDTPMITSAAAEAALPLAEQVVAGAPFTLVYDDYAWLISRKQTRDWLSFMVADGRVTVGLAGEALEQYLQEMAEVIDVPVQEAKFAMENNRVIEFQPSRIGRQLMIADSLERLNEKIRQIGVTEVELVVAEVEPDTTTDEANTLGIKTLLGEGRSNFAGSPSNRRHNISVGAATLNGILIEPRQEFSLVKTLGNIDASSGYLPELVIKGNKTIPEYGGGLCQIGTTAFRAALDAGFPITARRNHSYRVSYYEPAGTDATIYDPSPDFKFINDTGHYVLFTTKIEGNELIFQFYGTDDGRRVEQTEPHIYNIVKPGDTKLIETTDLAPGQKKCTESAHAGADAEFTRTVTYPDGRQKVDTFTSHYKPWPAVCLVGVEETPVEEPADTADDSSTIKTSETSDPPTANTNINSATNTNSAAI